MNQAENCYKCYKIPDDILMLACGHDLCLLCAAQVFGQKVSKKDFTCDLCWVVTELDASSVYELEKIHIQIQLNQLNARKISNTEINSRTTLSSQKQSKMQTDQKPEVRQFFDVRTLVQAKPTLEAYQKADTIPASKQEKENAKFVSRAGHHNPLQKSISKDSQISLQVASNSRERCQEHPEEEISYFCFDCLTKCICPECIIHGVHKSHEVQTVKKAYPHVRKTVENIFDANNEFQDIIHQQRQEIEHKQAQQDQIVENLKQSIKGEFQSLHDELLLKEQEILESVARIPTVIEQYRDFLIQIEESESQLNALNSKISNHLESREEISLLNFYALLSKQEIPPALDVPAEQEILTNHHAIFEALNEIKNKLGSIKLEIKKVSHYLQQQEDPFKYESSKSKGSERRKQTSK